MNDNNIDQNDNNSERSSQGDFGEIHAFEDAEQSAQPEISAEHSSGSRPDQEANPHAPEKAEATAENPGSETVPEGS